MKFSDRSGLERTAIDAWIRIAIRAREAACMKMPDGFKAAREQKISDSPEEVEKILRYYTVFRQGRHLVSYADYFQVSNPEEYAAILLDEKSHP